MTGYQKYRAATEWDREREIYHSDLKCQALPLNEGLHIFLFVLRLYNYRSSHNVNDMIYLNTNPWTA